MIAALAASLDRARRLDPRDYQNAVLGALLTLGVARLDFEVPPAQIVATIGAALATQRACDFLARRPTFEWKSALISALSLCLLLRAGSPWWGAAAAVIAVGSKFVLRWRGKHLFNPTNGAVVALLASGMPVWVSPAQWGHHVLLGFAMAGCGSLVVSRAARADVTFGFLIAWAGILFGRAAWLGQPWATPLHMFESGGLLLFAFHMISDPKTTPDSRAGRLVFAALVAIGAGFIQFVMFRTNGLLWSLAICSLGVPLLDRLLPGDRYTWSARMAGARPKGEPDASDIRAVPVPVARAAAARA